MHVGGGGGGGGQQHDYPGVTRLFLSRALGAALRRDFRAPEAADRDELTGRFVIFPSRVYVGTYIYLRKQTQCMYTIFPREIPLQPVDRRQRRAG